MFVIMRPPCYKMPTHLQRTRPSDCTYNKQWHILDVLRDVPIV